MTATPEQAALMAKWIEIVGDNDRAATVFNSLANQARKDRRINRTSPSLLSPEERQAFWDLYESVCTPPGDAAVFQVMDRLRHYDNFNE
jgi:hypothetical protein